MTCSRRRSCSAAASRYSTRPRWQTSSSEDIPPSIDDQATAASDAAAVERAREEEALPVVAAERPQRVPLLVLLDALGDDVELERLRRARRRPRSAFGCAVAQERPVELEDVDREAAEVAERRVARCRSRRARAARRAPSARCSRSTARSVSSMQRSTRSARARGARARGRRSRRATSSTSPGSCSCLADRFTFIRSAPPSASQSAWRPRAAPSDPIGTIRPVSSAIGMNSSGEISPRSGWRQRSSASKPHDLAVGEPHDRLVVQLQLARVDRALQVRAQLEPSEHVRVHRGLEQAVAALAGRAWPLYIAASASRIRSSAARPSPSSAIVMPTLVRSVDVAARRCAPARRAARGRAPPCRRPPGRPTSSSSSANSSPPKRAAVSAPRTPPSSRRATSISTSSPAAWPSESLIALKSSRSSEDARASEPASRRARGDAPRVRARRTAARLARPVTSVVEGLVGELGLEALALGDVARVEQDAADVLLVDQVREPHLEQRAARRRRSISVHSNGATSSPPATTVIESTIRCRSRKSANAATVSSPRMRRTDGLE